MNPEELLACVRASRTLRRTYTRLPAVLDAVVLVGATCVGKTTVGHAVRDSPAAASGRVHVPVRYITRPSRRNDCEVENRHVSHAAFEELVCRGALATHWLRGLGGSRVDRYGFPATPAIPLPVYSANNALLEGAAALHPADLLERALLVGIYAPDALRAERLQRRSPDLVSERPAEVATRLADRATSVLAHVHVVVENHGAGEAWAPAETVRLVELVAASRRPLRSGV